MDRNIPLQAFRVEIARRGELKIRWSQCPRCGEELKFKQCQSPRCQWNPKDRGIYGCVLLIGSMNFTEYFFELERNLTCMGYTVELPYWNELKANGLPNYTGKEWDQLPLHIFNKIEHLKPQTDSVFVVNAKMPGDKAGYLGEYTRDEIIFTLVTLERWGTIAWDHLGSIYPIDWDYVFRGLNGIEERWATLSANLSPKQQYHLKLLRRYVNALD